MTMRVSIMLVSLVASLAPNDLPAQQARRHRPAITAESLDRVYEQAQDSYYKKQYAKALENFQRYIDESTGQQTDHKRLIWSIDQIGRIYLREQRNPDAAIEFFNKLLDDPRLSEAEKAAISEWIGAAEDWKTVGKFPSATQDPDRQFELGEEFFKAGIRKAKFELDEAGNADFAIAQSYLLPFIVHNDADTRVGDALFMMGEIRRRLWNDQNYWTDNFYFKEVIRRFPHTELSWKAYKVLEDDTHFGYSGSGGDFTPKSVLRMLKTYKQLAQPK